jgi:hypothetical protein
MGYIESTRRIHRKGPFGISDEAPNVVFVSISPMFADGREASRQLSNSG